MFPRGSVLASDFFYLLVICPVHRIQFTLLPMMPPSAVRLLRHASTNIDLDLNLVSESLQFDFEFISSWGSPNFRKRFPLNVICLHLVSVLSQSVYAPRILSLLGLSIRYAVPFSISSDFSCRAQLLFYFPSNVFSLQLIFCWKKPKSAPHLNAPVTCDGASSIPRVQRRTIRLILNTIPFLSLLLWLLFFGVCFVTPPHLHPFIPLLDI